ncbi:enoyl-CoA hydratase [Bacillus coahuilensis m2-6]|uniref:enoyl-CoA hydratase/isomerase family protein n=1 Tax=Bacillus coahuilensis TaxID=408580 RepID=UPI0001850B86|nr:enoyl-CoA hydratase-related protein [Bacillus coahuilensis]KUP09297.1 enoyl-CoA hydratase [Bacillus coahuilensis m2-6]
MNQQLDHINRWIEGNIGIIELNRPHVLNAINRKMISEIVETLEIYDSLEEVHVVVLVGGGRAFAAGADIDEMAEVSSIELERLNQFRDWDRIAEMKKPMIGAVHGFAFGGGFELALCCDILLASYDTEFAFPEVTLGIMPGAGGTQRLTKLIGKNRAMEWLFTGDRMSAQIAYELGVVNRLVPKELIREETFRLATKISTNPAMSVRLIKESVLTAVDSTILEGMKYERKNFSLLFSSEDQKEGMRAFREKRKPQYKGR